MTDDNGLLVKLMALGAAIAAGNMLISDEKVTTKMFIGRVLLGTAVSLVSGALLIHIPDVPELAVIGVAAALGIAGHTVIEAWLKRKVSETGKEGKNEIK